MNGREIRTIEKVVWTIRGGLTDEEFPTEADAIVRSWELTTPGKDRWIVDPVVKQVPVKYDVYAVKRANEKKKRGMLPFNMNDILAEEKEREYGPGVKPYFHGRVKEMDELDQLHRNSRPPTPGAVVLVVHSDLLAIWKRSKDGIMVWDYADPSKLPASLIAKIKRDYPREWQPKPVYT